MGWTDDAIASGTLDAGFPPSYVGFALSSSSSGALGNADLVGFFMDECNASLVEKLATDEGRMHRHRRGRRRRPIAEMDVDEVSSRINVALRMRLSMVLPYVASRRWHEGVAIGALPQNALGTMGRLNDMADIVLGYALGGGDESARDGGGGWEHARRAAIIAAYATAEFHLLSDVWAAGSGPSSSTITSLGGERHRPTWTFLGERSTEAARLIVADIVPSSLLPLPPLPYPDPNVVVMASAAFSSLAGAALSLASPSAAASAGTAFPRAMDSALGILRGVLVGTWLGRTTGGDVGEGRGRRETEGGTRPSDYDAMESTAALPPFDSSEEIFPRGHPVK
ncbi:hypothetical protein ACHAXA_001657 [Cyclostephanos tholiformis]|uniref:Ubiquinone biosynthesis protein n=1 Tax=Cyclostephanos tholiformis TaxID=382380 RepID=A0ABD3RNX8_9STRA